MHKGADYHPYGRAEDAEMGRQENYPENNAEIIQNRSERIDDETVEIIKDGGEYRRESEEKNRDEDKASHGYRPNLVIRSEFADERGDEIGAQKKENYEKDKIENRK